MSRPEFFEPKPVSENIRIKFEDCEPIRRKYVLRRRPDYELPIGSVLGKRKMEDAFGLGMNDEERYGQKIPSDFFNTNIGHNVFIKNDHVNSDINKKINYWREKYGK
jgi:hypothetical protein